jgi:hypothetical protein
MKRVFVLLTLLVLAGLLLTALGLDRQQIALAQNEQPPVQAAPPLPAAPESPGSTQATTPGGTYNLPEGSQVSGGTIQAVPARQMSYQGRLLIGGAPCQGNQSITFRLWNAETLGASLWAETQTVTCDNGLFSVMLGKTIPLPLAQVFYNQLWLGIQPAGAAAELFPRQLLGTVPYAMNLHGGATMVDYNPAGGYGTSFYVYSTNHPAIYGQTTYTDSVAITGYASGDYAGVTVPTGVYGHSINGYGVQGIGNFAGVYGEGNVGVQGNVNGAGDIGVYGYTSSYSYTVGVEGVVYGDYSYGLYGFADGLNSTAVQAISYADSDYCSSTDPYCSATVAATTSGESYGVFSYSSGRNAFWGANNDLSWYTAWLYNDDVNGSALGVIGDTYIQGDLTVTGAKSGFVVDIALNAGDQPLERGDVVAVVGAAPPVMGEIPVMRVVKANAANAASIVGVVDRLWLPCDKPAEEVIDGQACGGYVDEATTIQPGQYVSVVTLGAYAYLKADASYGAIKAGDLLSISPMTEGVAGAAQQITVSGVSFYAPGTIIGKALGTLDAGTGYIAVFVSLK